VLQKNIYKSFKREPSDRIFETLPPAMGISDYRSKDFRVSFGRVTPARCICESTALFLVSVFDARISAKRIVCFGFGIIASSKNAPLRQTTRCICLAEKETARLRPGCF
jgi:hypothetical protein